MPSLLVGVDIGGTFTDCVVLDRDGTITATKAASTPDNFAEGMLATMRMAAERLGLSFEGIFRQATVYKGRNRDTAWYAAIDAEWPALRAAFLAWLDLGNFDGDGRQRSRLSDRTRPLLKQRG